MIDKIRVQAFVCPGQEPVAMELTLNEEKVCSLRQAAPKPEPPELYLSDGFIDSHAHVYDGATDLGVNVDRIGYNTGVHLVVDAGSAGAINFPCFRDYVMPAHQTPVKAFLNISRIGLVTKQPYYDARVIDEAAAQRCLKEDGGRYLLGVKVLSSGLIVEDAGLEPMRAAKRVAQACGVPLMAHLVEGPPSNEETMALMGKQDIITHCFHGAPNIKANQRASRGASINLRYCSMANVMWDEAGAPLQPLAEALERGAFLDVGHGAGSLDQRVARAAIQAGVRCFSISTDAHIRNVTGTVRDLPHTMSKFLAFGMSLPEVINAVTAIPAKQLGLTDWCGHLAQRSTLFRLRPIREQDPPFVDSLGAPIDVQQVVEPVATIRDARVFWIG